MALLTAVLVLCGLTAPRAGADPNLPVFAGVGGESTQFLFDAYGGFENGTFYIPLHSSQATGDLTFSSFDAGPAGTCITTKQSGGSFDRPSGSDQGVEALSAAFDGHGWMAPVSCTHQPVTITGQVDFARSRKVENVAGTVLTYLPQARDAIAYAFFDHQTGHVATLTTAQLDDLYTSATGSIQVGSDTLKACLTTQGGEPRLFFEEAIQVSNTDADRAAQAAGCDNVAENSADSFYNVVSGWPVGTDAAIDFSASSWIAQANGVIPDQSTSRANGVDLGAVDTLGKPYIAVVGTNLVVEAPSSTYYASPNYAADTYVVAPTSRVTGVGNASFKSLFVGSGSAVCSAVALATAKTFGFLPSQAPCGSTGLTSGFTY